MESWSTIWNSSAKHAAIIAVFSPGRGSVTPRSPPLVRTDSKNKTYSTWDSLVVTDPTTSQAIGGLSMGERTGSRVLHHLWPYVLVDGRAEGYVGVVFSR
jgi:hypothetical protein